MKYFKRSDVEFCLARDGKELLKNGIPVEEELSQQQLDVLRFLVESEPPRRLITKEELIKSVWGDTAVTDNSLTKAISKLRAVLGDDPEAPSFIKTVSRRGYRFIADTSDEPMLRNEEARPGEASFMRHDGDTRSISPPPKGLVLIDAAGAAEQPKIDLRQALDNETLMSLLRKWKRRPASCADQEIVGRFQVDGCSSAETTCARVLGIAPGELVEVTLDTPKSPQAKGDYEWINVNAIGPQAEFLERLGDHKDQAIILVRLRGYGAYICKRDYPDLETGKMQHYRDPKPALLVLAASTLQDAEKQGIENGDESTTALPVTARQRDEIRAERNKRLVAILAAHGSIRKADVLQLEDHTDKGYLVTVEFDPKRQSAAEVASLIRKTLDEMAPRVPFWGQLMSESEDAVSFGYSYIDEHNKAFRS